MVSPTHHSKSSINADIPSPYNFYDQEKLLYGIAKDDISLSIEKRKYKSRECRDMRKLSAVMPMPDRIPLPEIIPLEREEKNKWLRDVNKMTIISHQKPPSILMYTSLNTQGGTTCSEIADDSSLIALGYGNSEINLISLDVEKKIRKLHSAEELNEIDADCDDLNELLYDESTISTNVALTGHGGPVYSLSFSPDKKMLLSTARDDTIRLWSLDVQKNLLVYQMNAPVWQVCFCNRGLYFCSGSADNTVALWSTERMHPSRLFVESESQVACVDFHGNCNYILGGYEDKYIRIWDILSGNCVRRFSGHKAGIRAIKVSPDGRYVASVDGEGTVCLWDIGLDKLIGRDEQSAIGTMGAISFSRDGGVFAASYGRNNVSIYSVDDMISSSALKQVDKDENSNNESAFKMFSYPTKQTPVIGLHFTRRNLLLAVGPYNQ